MKKETIAAILTGEGIKSTAKGFELEGKREAACFIRGTSEPIVVGKITRISLLDDHLVLDADRDGQFFFCYEDVIGLRMNRVVKEGAAGFGR